MLCLFQNIQNRICYTNLSLSLSVPLGYGQVSAFQANKIVKFSQDENLTNEECHRLLTEFMPDHIQLTKITQKLFIK